MIKTNEQIASEWVEKNYTCSPFKEQLKTVFLAGMSHEEPYIRQYNRPVPSYGDLMTIEEWNRYINDGYINDDDGSGYWVKDGMCCNVWDGFDGDVFYGEPKDATHVVWFNK